MIVVKGGAGCDAAGPPRKKKLLSRTIDELWKAFGQSCDLFIPAECASYFAAVEYGFT